MRKHLRSMILTALMAAFSLALFLLEFPLFPAAGFLKLDFSDVPALLCSMLVGPGWGVLVELIKNLIGLLIRGAGDQMGFGNLMNFIVGIAFILPFTLIHRRGQKRGRFTANDKHERKAYYIACIVGIFSIAAVGALMNLAVMPLYFRYFVGREMPMEMILGAIGYATALNVIKGMVLSFSALLQRPLRVMLNRLQL